MKTVNDACFNCNHAYMNCYKTCKNSPAYDDVPSIVLTKESSEDKE